MKELTIRSALLPEGASCLQGGQRDEERRNAAFRSRELPGRAACTDVKEVIFGELASKQLEEAAETQLWVLLLVAAGEQQLSKFCLLFPPQNFS